MIAGNPASLDALLRALRADGFDIGVTEMVRIRQVLASGATSLPGRDSGRDLAAALCAVIAKSAGERTRLAGAIDRWPAALAPADAREQSPIPAPPPEPEAHKQSRRRVAIALVTFGAIAALAAIVAIVHNDDTPRAIPDASVSRDAGSRDGGSIVRSDAGSGPQAAIVPLPRLEPFEAMVPVLDVFPAPRPWNGWPALALAGLALLVGVLLATIHFRRRHAIRAPIEAAPEPVPGPIQRYLDAVELPEAHMISPRHRDLMVWGIGRYVAEQPTRALDIPATVRATCDQGGIPTLRYLHARHQREVWLWTDDETTHPALNPMAAEIAATLTRHGLPVEHAVFAGVPQVLCTESGQLVPPQDWEERRDAAIVCVLTDGAAVVAESRRADRAPHIEALLRFLAGWPQLAFVDFSADCSGSGDMAEILARHGIAHLAPSDLPAFLAGDSASADPAEPSPDLTAWAAACAISPSPVPETAALAVRDEIGLKISGLALAALGQHARAPGGRLQWPPADRARLVNWLYRAEAGPRTVFARALAFWRACHDRLVADAIASGTAAPSPGSAPEDKKWANTEAHQRAEMHRAVLDLWHPAGPDEPLPGVRDLRRLHQGVLAGALEQHMERLTARDLPAGPESIILPWRWRERTAADRAALAAMRFAGDAVPREQVSDSGRAWRGLGLVAGAVLAGLIAAATAGTQAPTGVPTIAREMGPRPAGAVTAVIRVGAQWHAFAAAGPVAATTVTGSKDDRFVLSWVPDNARSCIEHHSGLEIHRCGSRVPLADREPRFRRLRVDPHSPEAGRARHLARMLIDCGEATAVYIAAGDAQGALDAIPGLDDIGAVAMARLQKRECAICAGQQWTHPRAGVEFLGIPGGEFRMGSESGESPEPNVNEFPAHRVVVDSFWMARTETTNAQYDRFLAARSQQQKPLFRDHPKFSQPEQPVVGVTWHQASAYCAWLGETAGDGQTYRLPTEAEWEHACRAGRTGPWYFGTDPKQLEHHAWYGESFSGGQTHPVGQKPGKHPWGLHDMLGNVYEWTGDWYDDDLYKQRPTDEPANNPQGPTDSQKHSGYKVLRGGSFAFSAWDARCAYRFRFVPEKWLRFFGFRCVRSPRRQP